MAMFAVGTGGGGYDVNSEGDKLKSALHEVFTKIDEEYARMPARPACAFPAPPPRSAACADILASPRAAKAARSTKTSSATSSTRSIHR